MFSIVFIACKKETKDRVYATHIFWFDKATSDSLLVNGYGELHLDVPFIELHPGDVYRPSALASDWDSIEPPIKSALLMVRYEMNPGDTISFEYSVDATPPGGNPQNSGFDQLKNSSGQMKLKGGEIIDTKLEWK